MSGDPLRYALLTGGDGVEQWLADAMARAADQGIAECVAVARPARRLVLPNRAGTLTEVLRSPAHWGHFALRATLLKTPLTATLDGDEVAPGVDRIEVEVEQRGAVVRLTEESIERIRALDLDFVLLGEFGILRGAVLDVARHGVWSHHHGDPRRFRGRPSCFWELHDGEPVVSAGLQQLTSTLDGGRFLGLVSVATKPTFAGTMTSLYRASSTLLSTVAHHVRSTGALPPAVALPDPLPALRRRPGNREVVAAVGRVGRRMADRLRHGAFTRRDWQIGVAWHGGGAPWDVVPGAMQWLPNPSRKIFLADPCVGLDDGDRVIVFVEEFDYTRGYGVVSLLEVAGGKIVRRQVVLDDGHHHAFPQLVRRDDGWWATTDTCCEPGAVYGFRELGDRWEPVPGLTMPVGLSDPVLQERDGCWYAIGTDRRTDSASHFVRYVTAESEPGNWEPVAPFPAFVDVRVARGGGTHDLAAGVRVAQDCADGYGYGVTVTEYTGDLAALDAEVAHHPVTGTHTISWITAGTWVAADRCVDRFDPLAWRDRLRERRLRKRCRTR